MSLTKVLTEDRRLVILRTLSEVPGYNLNEAILRQALAQIGHPEASKDLVRADLQFLSEHGLIRIARLAMPSGELWIATLLEDGDAVANGRPHEGVGRRGPGG